MLPLIIAGIALVTSFFGFFFGGPTKENDTIAEIEASLKREEALKARQRANAETAKNLEAERKRTMEAAKLLQERNEIRAERKANEQLRLEDEKEKRQLAERMKELELREQHLRDEVDIANRLVEQERAARVAAENGLGPLRKPTRDEHNHALHITQYSKANFHFAVVGRAGSGKSSLINAFRNLRNKDDGAAPTGTRETTLEIGRYPDPGKEPPRKSIVWFDVPGAGTHRVSRHDYFIKQGLYVFDVIILAIGDRFEEIDARILDNCARFKIPAFIVRSKADAHILNSMQEYGDYERPDDDRECYDRCRGRFIFDTQNTADEELTRQGLPTKHVYIVSRDVLRRIYHAYTETSRLQITVPTFTRPEQNMIHESQLVNDLLTAAIQRRCEPNTEQSPRNWMRTNYESVLNHFGSRSEGPADLWSQDLPHTDLPTAGHAQEQGPIQARADHVATAGHAQQPEPAQVEVQAPVQARTDHVATAGHAQQPEPAHVEVQAPVEARIDPVAAAGHVQQPEPVQVEVRAPVQARIDPVATTGHAQEPETVQVSRDVVSRQSPMPRSAPNIRKIIHIPCDTNSAELYGEIVQHNPGLTPMLAGRPSMFTPKVAMLAFYPSAVIPRDLKVFGVWLRLAVYQDRGNGRGGRGGQGGRGGRGFGRATGRGRGRGSNV